MSICQLLPDLPVHWQLFMCLSPACLSAACLQVCCMYAQSSKRHPAAHEPEPILQSISLSLWAMLQIFLLDMEGGYRGHASGQKWHEDLQWAHRLDDGWNLAAVKQVSCQNISSPDPCPCLQGGLQCISSNTPPSLAPCRFP